MSVLSCKAEIVVVCKVAAKPPVKRSALSPATTSSQLLLSAENCHW